MILDEAPGLIYIKSFLVMFLHQPPPLLLNLTKLCYIVMGQKLD